MHNLEHQSFGHLTVLRRDRTKRKSTNAYWLCACDCGEQTIARGSHLTGRKIASCGCRARISHGHTIGQKRSGEYNSWLGMHQRCYSATSISYKNYGGRGISVCERWNDFKNFLSDVGLKPSAKHSIDRIDVNGNYEPGNCRWATGVEQAANKRPSELRWLRRDA